MSPFVIAIAGLLAGWSLAAGFVVFVCCLEEHLKVLLGFFAFLCGLLVFGVTFGEALHYPRAYQIEQILADQRSVALLLWLFAGFAAFVYRNQLRQHVRYLWFTALVPPKGQRTDHSEGSNQTKSSSPRLRSRPQRLNPPIVEKDEPDPVDLSLPWFVQAGAFGALLIAAVFAFNPNMLKGLTSFKAGSVEAHFSAAAQVGQKAQVTVLDQNRKSTLSNWMKFTFDDPARKSAYILNAKNKNNTLNEWRLEFSKLYYQDQIYPLLCVLQNREMSYRKLASQNFDLLQDISTRLANQIESDLDRSKKPLAAHQIRTLKNVAAKISIFISKTGYTRAQCESAKSVAFSDEEKPASLISMLNGGIDFIEMVERHYVANSTNEDANILSENIWDPYIIQAVADLLGRSTDRRQRENFLEVVTTLTDKDDGICQQICDFPVTGRSSLIYAAVDAKIQSEQPWPFDRMFKQVSGLLLDTQDMIDNKSYGLAASQVARKNRLIDLSLGLQLFYQRSLTGQHFSPAQVQAWSDWLSESEKIIALIEGRAWPKDFGEEESRAWVDTRSLIASDPAIIQDAATAAALSAVLLPALKDGASGSDCVVSKSLFDFASSENLDKFTSAMRFDVDEIESYRGLLEQMKTRIEEECQ